MVIRNSYGMECSDASRTVATLHIIHAAQQSKRI